jgi:dTDP-glucose 4,6-dehydratase
MSILVTGAAGFIGSNFVLNWLSEHKEKVIALDKLTYAGNLENLKQWIKSSQLCFCARRHWRFKLMAKLLQEHQPRAIVNFAAESHVDRSIHGPDDFMQTNIIGTYRLLEEARSFFNTLSDEAKNSFVFYMCQPTRCMAP